MATCEYAEIGLSGGAEANGDGYGEGAIAGAPVETLPDGPVTTIAGPPDPNMGPWMTIRPTFVATFVLPLGG